MKLLLHSCCAPCSVYCIDSLRKENIEPTIFWYNPNIHPFEEYKQRRDCLKEYTSSIGVEAIFFDEYGLDEFCKNTINNLNNRCTNYCYPLRLRKTFEYAKENGYDAVSTTLLYSIYQKHNFIKAYMEKLSKEFEIEFLYRDFRIGFWEGHQKAYDLGLYMQKYCGCIFSEEESAYYNRNSSKPQLPEGFKFIKRTPLEVKRIIDTKIIDEFLKEKDNGKLIEIKNLQDFDIFGLKRKDEILSLIIISHISKTEVEIKELITKKEYRNQGFGTKLLKSMFGNYKQKYKNMIISTTGEYVPYFVEQGFKKFIKQDNNILYYKKELKTEKWINITKIYIM